MTGAGTNWTTRPIRRWPSNATIAPSKSVVNAIIAATVPNGALEPACASLGTDWLSSEAIKESAVNGASTREVVNKRRNDEHAALASKVSVAPCGMKLVIELKTTVAAETLMTTIKQAAMRAPGSALLWARYQGQFMLLHCAALCFGSSGDGRPRKGSARSDVGHAASSVIAAGPREHAAADATRAVSR